MVNEIKFDCTEVSKEIANFTVGLCKLSIHHGVEDAVPAGSGSLVKLGSVSGILTAAHVLKNLPDEGDVALVRFPDRQNILQKQIINMAQAEKVIICPDTFGPTGPDLGFLRLPLMNVSNLEATNNFLNIGDRSRSMAASDQPSPPYFDTILGVVGEWTQDLPPRQPSTRLKSLELLFGGGEIVTKYEVDGFDLCKFKVSFCEDLKPPSSYGGVSGGGLWRVYVDADESGNNTVREKRLMGVAFFECDTDDENPLIICHGPKSVYCYLIDAMRKRWPNETSIPLP